MMKQCHTFAAKGERVQERGTEFYADDLPQQQQQPQQQQRFQRPSSHANQLW
jgi:hypothetical protein